MSRLAVLIRASIPASVAALLPFLAASLVVARASPTAAGPAHGARTHTVTIEQLRFHPEALVVARGDRIVWINRDLFPHTVTAADGTFDSQAIPAAGRWSYLATRAGEYDYRCSYHPTMRARLIVR